MDADGGASDFSVVLGFASHFTDLDGDGWPDLAVASDFGTSRLFWNNGDGTFTDGTATAGVGTDENGMGSTIGDFDGDGLLDWFVTSIYDPDCPTCGWGITGNRLYRNLGDRTFEDATDAAGVRDNSWGWGTSFLDYDNDGDLDLVATNGIDFAQADEDAEFNHEPMRFWRNDGGVYTEVAEELGIDDPGSCKGLLTFDFDLDGDQDVLVLNNNGPVKLYRNDGGNANGWLRIDTKGSVSNSNGLGTFIEVTPEPGGPTSIREIGSASGFLGQSEATAHFGLGDEIDYVSEVKVRWPSGLTRQYVNVPKNTTLVLNEEISDPQFVSMEMSIPSGGEIAVGQPVYVRSYFSDADAYEQHNFEIDWGDGTISQGEISENASSGQLYAEHTYHAAGIYIITMTLSDANSGSTTISDSLEVSGTNLSGSVLQSVGTYGEQMADLSVTDSADREILEVKAEIASARTLVLNPKNVTPIDMLMTGGDLSWPGTGQQEDVVRTDRVAALLNRIRPIGPVVALDAKSIFNLTELDKLLVRSGLDWLFAHLDDEFLGDSAHDMVTPLKNWIGLAN